MCRVNGSRCYSLDLPQGGLEVPCILIFSTPQAHESEKTKKLIESSLAVPVKLTSDTKDYQIKVSPGIPCSTNASCSTSLATLTDVLENDEEFKELQPLKQKLKLHDGEIEGIIMGVELSDLYINMAQRTLKNQFPELNGLESSLFQDKERSLTNDNVKNKLQIIHCKQHHHWIVASTVKREVIVIDSLFRLIDEETKQIVINLFQYDCEKPPRIRVIKTQKQKGNKDCGLFAIAMATATAFGNDPSRQSFCLDLMRAHLVDCLKNERFSIMFP